MPWKINEKETSTIGTCEPVEGALMPYNTWSVTETGKCQFPQQEDISYWPQEKEIYFLLWNRKYNYYPSPAGEKKTSFLPSNKPGQCVKHRHSTTESPLLPKFLFSSNKCSFSLSWWLFSLSYLPYYKSLPCCVTHTHSDKHAMSLDQINLNCPK